MNKVKTKNQKDFSTEIRNSNVFSGRKQVFSKKNEKVFIPKMSWNPVSLHKNYKNTGGKHQFGFDLHSSSPEPVNFFGAQSSLGGTIFVWGGTSSHLVGHGPGMLPRGAGPELREVS